MTITCIIITFIAINLIIFPEFFMKLKSPRIPEKLSKSPKFKIVIRIWGIICTILGLTLTIISIINS